jgi:spore coat polysaccharide biosynthesis protein SpsF
MKVGFLITARLKSSRLPLKLLKEVNGENLITWMIKRLQLCKELDEIVICTSTNPQDDPLEEIAEKNGIQCFRGSEEDVISRLYDAAIKYKLDYVINMTADCPFVPFDYIPSVIETYKNTNADLVKCFSLPPGLFLSGLKIEAMKKVIDLKDSNYTEYWLAYFLKSGLFKVVEIDIESRFKNKNYRIVLDYPEDYEFMLKLYEGLGADAYKKSTTEIIKYLDSNPELATINWHCTEKGAIRTNEDPTSKIFLKSN